MFRGDRTAKPSQKYVHTRVAVRRPEFAGDNRDARSWAHWCALWLGLCLRIVRPGGYALLFTDWRQLPAATDALQAGGWVWRGVIAWDKGLASRIPHTGYFRHQCEYVQLTENALGQNRQIARIICGNESQYGGGAHNVGQCCSGSQK